MLLHNNHQNEYKWFKINQNIERILRTTNKRQSLRNTKNNKQESYKNLKFRTGEHKTAQNDFFQIKNTGFCLP